MFAAFWKSLESMFFNAILRIISQELGFLLVHLRSSNGLFRHVLSQQPLPIAAVASMGLPMAIEMVDWPTRFLFVAHRS